MNVSDRLGLWDDYYFSFAFYFGLEEEPEVKRNLGMIECDAIRYR